MTVVKTNSLQISWSAIAIGVLVVITVQSLFNFLALGLGLMAFSPTMDTLKQLSVVSILWLMATNIITLFLGGWLAGQCNPLYQKFQGALQGLIVWAIAMLLTFILVASAAGILVNSSLNTLSQGLSLVGSEAFSGLGLAAKPMLEPIADHAMEQAKEVVSNMSFSTTPDDHTPADQSKQRLTQFVVRLLNAPTGDDVQTSRQKISTFLNKNTSLSQSQIDQTISDWQQTYADVTQQASQKAAQAKQKAIEATNQTSSLLGKLALLFFLVLFIGAIAASLGGLWAVKPPDRRSVL